MREKEHREMKFMASLQGVDLDEAAKEPEDVTALKNARIASDEGFGIGEGLGFMLQE